MKKCGTGTRRFKLFKVIYFAAKRNVCNFATAKTSVTFQFLLRLTKSLLLQQTFSFSCLKIVCGKSFSISHFFTVSSYIQLRSARFVVLAESAKSQPETLPIMAYLSFRNLCVIVRFVAVLIFFKNISWDFLRFVSFVKFCKFSEGKSFKRIWRRSNELFMGIWMNWRVCAFWVGFR